MAVTQMVFRRALLADPTAMSPLARQPRPAACARYCHTHQLCRCVWGLLICLDALIGARNARPSKSELSHPSRLHDPGPCAAELVIRHCAHHSRSMSHLKGRVPSGRAVSLGQRAEPPGSGRWGARRRSSHAHTNPGVVRPVRILTANRYPRASTSASKTTRIRREVRSAR